MKETIQFLKALQSNNTKEWFDDNKKTYESCKNEFLALTQEIINGISKFDANLTSVDAKKCMFRINRDVRFGHDKTPYKTNFGALMGVDGKKTEGVGYYFHIAPENNFVGGGIYMPAVDKLAAIRQEIDYNPDALNQLIQSADFKNTFGQIRGEALKTAPKGYPKDHPHIELLKLKSFYVLKEYTDVELSATSFLNEALSTCEKAYAFNKYLKLAIS